jgi:hypothetical protein
LSFWGRTGSQEETWGEGDKWREAAAAEMRLLKEGRGWQWSWVQEE